MGMEYSDKTSVVGKAQADGAQTITCSPYATDHQIAAQTSSGSVTGTLAVQVRAFGRTDFETLYDDYGAAVIINLATASYNSVRIRGASLEAIKLTPTSVANGTYSIAACGWSN